MVDPKIKSNGMVLSHMNCWKLLPSNLEMVSKQSLKTNVIADPRFEIRMKNHKQTSE
jgi:hypothetical protein